MRPVYGPGWPVTDSQLVISPVSGKADLDRFIRLPWALYRDDPCWVPPLIFERREHLDPKKNPFFDHAEIGLWLAWRGGRPVGRISAQIDQAYLERYNDATGHFGLLEAVNDDEVFAGLLNCAGDWLRARGMARVVGPFSLSINEESGLLVDGFETPPSIMMGHVHPYYGARVEAQGFTKVKDLVCYRYSLEGPVPAIVEKFVTKASRDKRLTVRPVSLRNFHTDLTKILDIFNDAWSQNWGYVPMSDAEIGHMAKALKPIIRPEAAVIAELDGVPVAMAVSLPNINEAIADLDGKMLPFGWLKLLWRIKVKTPKSARMALMGVRREFHGSPLGAALAFSVLSTIRDGQRRLGVKGGELSWILEDNMAMRRMVEQFGAEPYKTYRIYERAL